MNCIGCGKITTNVLREKGRFVYFCKDCQRYKELERSIFEECLKIFPDKTVIINH